MDFVIVQVVIGLSFLFFLLSIVASAVNEGIAGIFGLRARTLEQGISDLLTGSAHPTGADAEIVERFYDHALINGYAKGRSKPSYLASRSFRNVLFDLTGLLESTAEPSDDPLPADAIRRGVEEAIGALPNEHLRASLTAIWRSVNHDAEEFRAGVERWFDRGMERVSGWYKRRAQIIVFVVGLVVTVAINASALTAADRLWKDNGFREGLIAQVENQPQAINGTDALDRLEELQFPIGWEDANRPDDVGSWALALFGWILTAAAITLGAPFWFDLLGKVSNLRAAGVKPASAIASVPSRSAASTVTLDIRTDGRAT